MCEVFYWGFDVGFKDVEVFEFVVEYSWMAPQTSTMMVMRGFTFQPCVLGYLSMDLNGCFG